MSELKIIFLSNRNSVFIDNFVQELVLRKIHIHIFDPTIFTLFDSRWNIIQKFNKPPQFLDKIPKIGYLIKLILLRKIYGVLAGKYDICHIHYNMKFYADIAEIINRIGKKLLISIWGSDFYKRNNKDRILQDIIYQLADWITFSQDITRNDFIKFYGKQYKNKTSVVCYGLRPLEQIKRLRNFNKQDLKSLWKIPQESLIITVGSCATPNQNHQKIVDNLVLIQDKIKSNVLFLFPLTYGDPGYKKRIVPILERSGLSIKVISDFLSNADVARLRLITDVMIILQDTDQLSGAMIEHLYAGSVVITGDWLPYETLASKGVFFIQINSINDIGSRVTEVIRALKELKVRTKVNRNILANIYLWEQVIPKWITFYKDLLSS